MSNDVWSMPLGKILSLPKEAYPSNSRESVRLNMSIRVVVISGIGCVQ